MRSRELIGVVQGDKFMANPSSFFRSTKIKRTAIFVAGYMADANIPPDQIANPPGLPGKTIYILNTNSNSTESIQIEYLFE